METRAAPLETFKINLFAFQFQPIHIYSIVCSIVQMKLIKYTLNFKALLCSVIFVKSLTHKQLCCSLNKFRYNRTWPTMSHVDFLIMIFYYTSFIHWNHFFFFYSASCWQRATVWMAYSLDSFCSIMWSHANFLFKKGVKGFGLRENYAKHQLWHNLSTCLMNNSIYFQRYRIE